MSDKDWKEVVLEEGDVWDRQEPIEGTLVKVRENVGPNESMLYTLRTEKGDISVWGSTVLDTKFENLAKGSEVRIEPQGEVTSPTTKRKYQDFKLFVKPPAYKEVGGEPLPDAPSDLPFN